MAKAEAKDSPGEMIGGERNPHPTGAPEYYRWMIDQIGRLAVTPPTPDVRISSTEAQRQIKIVERRAAAAGVDLSAPTNTYEAAFERLLRRPSLLEHNEQELNELKEAFVAAEALGADDVGVKKNWVRLIDLALKLQEKARSNVVYHSLYVIRCQQTNRLLNMESVHVSILSCWNHPDLTNSLVMAHPGVGKTTLVYGQATYDLGQDQRLRCLMLAGNVHDGRARVRVVRQYIQSPRMLALYPAVRVDPAEPDNADEFTLSRPNIGSHDPTMRAAGISGTVQGAGFERMYCDDICGEDVRREPTTRDNIIDKFTGVVLQRKRDHVNSRIRYIATPWHILDCTWHLLTNIQQGMPGWDHRVLALREDEHGTPVPLVDRPGLVDTILQTKLLRPDIYSCTYLMNPNVESDRKLSCVKYYDESGGTSPHCPTMTHERSGLPFAEFCKVTLARIRAAERWVAVDPAFGGADETAMVHFALNEEKGTAAILDCKLTSFRGPELVQAIIEALTVDGADYVLIEQAGPQKGFADLTAQMIHDRLGAEYAGKVRFSGTKMYDARQQAYGPNLKKSERFKMVVPYLEQGSVLFPGQWVNEGGLPKLVCSDRSQLRKLHDQLLEYPNVVRDDGIDAVAMFINYHLPTLRKSIDAIRRAAAPVKFQTVSRLSELYRTSAKSRREAPDEDDWVDHEAAMFGLHYVA